MATLANLLTWAGAPDELARWAIDRPDAEADLMEADDARLRDLLLACPRPKWMPWLAAVATFLIDLVLAAVGMAIETQSDDERITSALEEAYATVTRESSGDECLAAADRCEGLADDPPRSFRTDGARFAKLARATALVLRAAEAISAAMVRDEAERMNRARTTASRFGGGASAFYAPAGPTVLAMHALAVGGKEAPPTPELAFAVAALSEALGLVAELGGDHDTRNAFVGAL